MHKLMLAIAASAAFGMLPVSLAAADDTTNTAKTTNTSKPRHTRQHVQAASSEAETDPAVRDGYRMNGNFDWRRRGENVPWYGHGYNDNCVAWEQNAYHYACDINSRY
jgi:Ni/Co efflux regulator RcnB